MKRFKSFNKVLSMVLAILIFFSGFSIVTASALDFSNVFQGNSGKYITDLGATFDEAAVGANSYTVKWNTNWGLKWVNQKTYTNVFTGKKETLYANQNLPYHTVGGSTAWCIQPYTAISTTTYYKQGSGANSDYWNKVNAKSKADYKEALARTIAFAKPQMTAQASNNNEYYHAAQLILWEIIMGYRNPTTLAIKSSNKLINNVSCTTSTNKTKLTKAYNYIIKQMTEEEDIPSSLNKTIAKAKTNRTKSEKRITLNNKTHSKTKPIANLTDYEWSSVKVVNQNGNVAGKSWGFNVSVKGNKVTVSAEKSIADEKTTSRFYLRFTKKIDYKKSTSNVVYQASYASSQTLCNSLSYSNTVYAYYPLFEKIEDEEPTGSLQISKTATLKNGGNYEDSLKGWYFLVTNNTTKKSTLLSTGKSGDTDTIEEIKLGTKFTIKELGKKITSNESEYSNVTTYDNVSYGFPDGWESITETKTITVNDSGATTEVSWKNQYNNKMKVNINKSCSDGDSVDGYYFLVYDTEMFNNAIDSTSALITPIIVGPTNADGDIEFSIDNPKTDVLAVLELGKLKKGYSVPTAPSNVYEIMAGTYREAFEVPSKYNAQKGTYAVTGISTAIPFSITVAEVANLYKDIYIENTTSGYISINKTNSVNGKPVEGAVYGIYTPTQPAEESDVDGDIVEDSTEPPTEDITDADTEYVPDDDVEIEATESVEEDDVVIGSDDDTDDTPVNLICTITTDENGYAISELIPTGDYYIKEISSPNNYALDTNTYDVTVTPGSNTVATAINVQLKDKPTQLIINKKEVSTLSSNGKQLAGAQIQVFEKPKSGTIDYDNDTPVYEFTSTSNPEKLVGILEKGKTYVIHEVSAPNGYYVAADIEKTISDDGSVDQVTVNDKTTYIQFKKVDSSTSNLVEGAVLQLKDKDGNIVKVPNKEGNWVESWTTSSEPFVVEGVLLPNEKYTLSEISVPKGYATAEPLEFTVNGNGETQTIIMNDEPIIVSITKTDITGEKEVEGAQLQITDKNGEVIASWTSGKEAYVIKYSFIAGETYTLTETKPADGYVTAESVNFTISDTGVVQTVTMKDDTTKVLLSKKTLTGSDELEGCELQVTDKDGNVIDSWTSTNEAHLIEGKLIVGETYTMTETKPADGYTTAESIQFTVSDTGEVQTQTMKDDTTKVEFSKKTLTGSDELEGCQLQVTDKDGNVIDSWTSTNEAHLIEGKLIVGETYTFTETKPADGYATANSIVFTVSDTGEVQTQTMKDDTTKVEFSKKTLTGSDELEGCQLQVTDKDGNVIDSWTSTNEAHLIEGKLIVGETYTFTETKPADGYTTAESIEFTVSDTGEVQTQTMKDDTTKVLLSKKTLTGSDELEGCQLQVTDKDGNVIDSWTSTNEAHLIEGKLIVGETYTMTETKPADGYTTAESIQFTVSDTGEMQKVEMADDTTKVEFAKIAKDTNKNLAKAKLQLKDTDGNEIETWITTDDTHYIEGKLVAGKTYILSEISAPNGYEKAEDVKFTVNTDGTKQTVTMVDEKTPVDVSLPTTGGNSTLPLFFALGLSMMMAGIFIFCRAKTKD
jgi:uncharacterized surface anchored protein